MDYNGTVPINCTALNSTVIVLEDGIEFNCPDEIVPEQNSTKSSEPFVWDFPLYMKIYVTLFLTLIFVIGVFGNILVPLVIWKNPRMRNSTNIFLATLSLADLLVLLVCVPAALVEIHNEPFTWVMGKFMCKLVNYLIYATIQISSVVIFAIGFERYYAICRPLSAGYKLTSKRGIFVSSAIWIVVSLCSIPFLINYTYVESKGKGYCYLPPNDFRIYNAITIIIFYFLPLILLIVLYSLIIRKLSTMKNVGASKESSKFKQRKQVVYMLTAVVVAYFLLLLPTRIIAVIFVTTSFNFGTKKELMFNIIYFGRIMLYLNSAINPILYDIMSTRFRNAFLRLLGLSRFITDTRDETASCRTSTYAISMSVKSTTSNGKT